MKTFNDIYLLSDFRKAYRKFFEKQVTPLILDIEEQPKHQDHVHHGDHDHYNHAAVQGHSAVRFST